MNLYLLEVKFNHNQQEDCLYPVILRSHPETILVDCGYAGFLPLLEEAASQHGISLAELTGVIITHHDIDHMGGLHELKAKYPSIQVYTSEIEAPYVSGKAKSLRLVQAEDMYDSLPEAYKPGAGHFQEMLRNMQTVPVDAILPQEGPLPFLVGVQIIPTPGHMPGHFSLYLTDSSTLIAADALVYEAGELNIANPGYTLDLPRAIASAHQLRKWNTDAIVCYHGGVVKENIQQKFNNLTARYPK
jgi:glyoxylase-like metal-dependent hydrolase (beta-lactamase superfamily II)